MAGSIKTPDFEARSVVTAYRTPVFALLLVTIFHAAILAGLGHPILAMIWCIAMVVVDFINYLHASVLLARENIKESDIEVRLACISFLRFTVIMSGAAWAAFFRPAAPELMFLSLCTAAVSIGATLASGYRIKLILSGFVPAMLGLGLGLSRLWNTPSFVIMSAEVLFIVILMIGFLRGAKFFAAARKSLVRERLQALVDLMATRDRLEDELEAKSDFMSTLSHEVRTPLNGVMGLAQVLAQTSLDKEQKEHVETIIASGAMMRAILDDVLDAAKIEAGRMQLSPSPANLLLILQQIARVWRAPAQLKGINFEFQCDLDETTYFIDAVRLQQIVNNFLSNAIKFTSAGGVILKAKIQFGSPDSLRIEVRDSGIGLTPDACDKLFGRFVQADATVAGRFGGSGVGLYVCKNLVGLMNGQIGVLSAVGQGSTFWFEIPVVEADAHAPAEPEQKEPGPRLKLLVVDDNPTNRKVVTMLVESLGHDCETSESGRAGLSRLRDELFDAVLLDLRMPEFDGYQTLQELRGGTGPNHACPVFALTADAADWTDQVAGARGFDGFVAKPIEVAKLAQALEKITDLTGARLCSSLADKKEFRLA